MHAQDAAFFVSTGVSFFVHYFSPLDIYLSLPGIISGITLVAIFPSSNAGDGAGFGAN